MAVFVHSCTPPKTLKKKKTNKNMKTGHSRNRMQRATARYPCATARWHGLLSDQVRSCIDPSRASNCVHARTARPRGTSAQSRASMSCSRDKSLQLACTRAPWLVRSRVPKNMHYGAPTRAHTRAVLLQMARKGKEAATSSTPSRSRTTKNLSRGRDDGFSAD
ncbi:hypothetical protein PIB30_062678 [Stylosanthes scabra]|uniref:Uncharacterized protein n=1 Tax=Stylosanthes scabra TaxID=79078 RepID=A0ABU6UK03_9FABA|nr:hypothetical protein [Stylosanthes scabra]